MPIAKRRNLPEPPKPRITNAATMTYPGKPISMLIADYDRLASDAAWNGDDAEASRLQAVADGYRKRLENGELYEVDF